MALVYRYRLLIGLVAAVLLAGCGGSTTATPSPTAAPTATPSPVPPPDMPEMEIETVRPTPSRDSGIVLLREKGSDRYLPIWIGLNEATAIAVKLEQISLPRPLTHDLLDSMITHLGGHVRHVIINDFVDNTYYAKIVLSRNGDTIEVDSRPSDALALALRANVPVYADESVLERAGIILESPDEDVPNGQDDTNGFN